MLSTLPNGATANYTYDILGRVTQLINMAGPGNVLDSYSYHFNKKGLRSRVTYADGRYTDFEYDKLYRLTKEIQKSAHGSTIYDHQYTVNKAGNRTNLKCDNDASKVISYSYNDFNQLTSFSGTGGNKINVTGTVGDATAGIESVVVTDTENSDSVTADLRGDFFIARGLTLASDGDADDYNSGRRRGNFRSCRYSWYT